MNTKLKIYKDLQFLIWTWEILLSITYMHDASIQHAPKIWAVHCIEKDLIKSQPSFMPYFCNDSQCLDLARIEQKKWIDRRIWVDRWRRSKVWVDRWRGSGYIGEGGQIESQLLDRNRSNWIPKIDHHPGERIRNPFSLSSSSLPSVPLSSMTLKNPEAAMTWFLWTDNRGKGVC